MVAIPWAKIGLWVLRYWYIFVILGLGFYIWTLRGDVAKGTAKVNELNTALAIKSKEVSEYRVKLDVQSKAVDDLAQKGKEQAYRLNVAIEKVNAMKPATQTITREIYNDKTTDANKLLYNARND